MDTPVTQKPKTMAELLPGLSGILTKDARQAITVMKQPRPTIAATRTAEKSFKPMTIAEMRADIKVLKVPSPRKTAQPPTSMKKKWNSSIKVKKTISLTENRQVKTNTVRKVLNFQQPKPRIPIMHAAANSRMTLNPCTPKFLRPEIKAKRSLHPQAEEKACNILSISGICHIEETPLLVNKPAKPRITMANKENSIPSVKIIATTPKSSLRKRVLISLKPDTPLSNESWKSSCDDSFLQNEKDIELINKTKPLTEPNALNDMAKVSPPASTPYKEYRNVNEIFNNTSINNNSSMSYQDNTIMSFDTTSVTNENNKREESVIVSLCDMLNKATVSTTNTKKECTDLEYLLEVEKQTVKNLDMIESGIRMLNSVKESELTSLQSVRKLIEKNQKKTSESENEKTIIASTKEIPIHEELTPIKSQVAKPCSVIKSCLKSPSYKIPKKLTSSVRKKVHYRSLPNVANFKVTPEKDMGGRALSMYLKMKEHMGFLSTPAGKQPPRNVVMDTPTIASHNLQKQLDNLYNES